MTPSERIKALESALGKAVDIICKLTNSIELHNPNSNLIEEASKLIDELSEIRKVLP